MSYLEGGGELQLYTVTCNREITYGMKEDRDIFIIKSTRCTNFSNLFFAIELYMFRAVSLSIIRSLAMNTQQ